MRTALFSLVDTENSRLALIPKTNGFQNSPLPIVPCACSPSGISDRTKHALFLSFCALLQYTPYNIHPKLHKVLLTVVPTTTSTGQISRTFSLPCLDLVYIYWCNFYWVSTTHKLYVKSSEIEGKTLGSRLSSDIKYSALGCTIEFPFPPKSPTANIFIYSRIRWPGLSIGEHFLADLQAIEVSEINQTQAMKLRNQSQPVLSYVSKKVQHRAHCAVSVESWIVRLFQY